MTTTHPADPADPADELMRAIEYYALLVAETYRHPTESKGARAIHRQVLYRRIAALAAAPASEPAPCDDGARADLLDELEDCRLENIDNTAGQMLGEAIAWINGEREEAAPPAAVPAVERDATRYRWLRSIDSYAEWNRAGHYAGPALDATIDAAMSAHQTGDTHE